MPEQTQTIKKRGRGRPPGPQPENPKQFSALYTISLTPEMKALVIERGGAGYIRKLIDKDCNN